MTLVVFTLRYFQGKEKYQHNSVLRIKIIKSHLFLNVREIFIGLFYEFYLALFADVNYALRAFLIKHSKHEDL